MLVQWLGKRIERAHYGCRQESRLYQHVQIPHLCTAAILFGLQLIRETQTDALKQSSLKAPNYRQAAHIRCGPTDKHQLRTGSARRPFTASE